MFFKDNDETAEDEPTPAAGHHPHFDRAVMRSRRKSVSFAVYKVNADTMQFDIEHKSVLLGNLSASNSASAKKITAKQPSGSPLREVAKKWRDAKNKLVIKGLYHLLVAPFQRFHTFFLYYLQIV